MYLHKTQPDDEARYRFLGSDADNEILLLVRSTVSALPPDGLLVAGYCQAAGHCKTPKEAHFTFWEEHLADF